MNRRRVARQPLPWRTSIVRTGRFAYTVWATTIPAGGTAVETWRRPTRASAERLQRRIHRLQARRAAWAEETP